jgi:hypothetical protein
VEVNTSWINERSVKLLDGSFRFVNKT